MHVNTNVTDRDMVIEAEIREVRRTPEPVSPIHDRIQRGEADQVHGMDDRRASFSSEEDFKGTQKLVQGDSLRHRLLVDSNQTVDARVPPGHQVDAVNRDLIKAQILPNCTYATVAAPPVAKWRQVGTYLILLVTLLCVLAQLFRMS